MGGLASIAVPPPRGGRASNDDNIGRPDFLTEVRPPRLQTVRVRGGDYESPRRKNSYRAIREHPYAFCLVFKPACDERCEERDRKEKRGKVVVEKRRAGYEGKEGQECKNISEKKDHNRIFFLVIRRASYDSSEISEKRSEDGERACDPDKYVSNKHNIPGAREAYRLHHKRPEIPWTHHRVGTPHGVAGDSQKKLVERRFYNRRVCGDVRNSEKRSHGGELFFRRKKRAINADKENKKYDYRDTKETERIAVLPLS